MPISCSQKRTAFASLVNWMLLCCSSNHCWKQESFYSANKWKEALERRTARVSLAYQGKVEISALTRYRLSEEFYSIQLCDIT